MTTTAPVTATVTNTMIRECAARFRIAQFQNAVRNRLQLQPGTSADLQLQPMPTPTPGRGFFLTAVTIVNDLGAEPPAVMAGYLTDGLDRDLAAMLEELDHAAVRAKTRGEQHTLTMRIPGTRPAAFGSWMRIDTTAARDWLIAGGDYKSTNWAIDLDNGVADEVTDIAAAMARAGIITSPVGAVAALDPIVDEEPTVRVMVTLHEDSSLVDTLTPLSYFFNTDPEPGEVFPGIARMVTALAELVDNADQMLDRFYRTFQLAG